MINESFFFFLSNKLKIVLIGKQTHLSLACNYPNESPAHPMTLVFLIDGFQTQKNRISNDIREIKSFLESQSSFFFVCLEQFWGFFFSIVDIFFIESGCMYRSLAIIASSMQKSKKIILMIKFLERDRRYLTNIFGLYVIAVHPENG